MLEKYHKLQPKPKTTDELKVALHTILEESCHNNTSTRRVWRTSPSVVALSVEYRTCDQEVVGSSLCRAHGVKTLGQVAHTYVPLFTKQYKLVLAKGR